MNWPTVMRTIRIAVAVAVLALPPAVRAADSGSDAQFQQALDLKAKGEGIAREGLAWTPDGRYLLFVKTSGPNRSELFRVPAGGGRPETTDISERGLSLLSVHPDGTHITYTVGQYFQVDVWALENFLPGVRASQ